ncbi:granzyme A-like [Pyxicephalus adspersus]|uniref:granzyme A-like n=1 Tax=Pyxicephalus adspersus TaxID=30357 RepID=UPI003B593527
MPYHIYQCNAPQITWQAHCACDSSTKIKLGAHLKKNDGKIFNAKNCIQHKAYNKCTNDNDLQLVQLSNKAKQTKNVKIQPLPKIFNDVEEGTVCDTAGWGAITSNRRTFPGVLMEVNLTAISRKRCAEMWKPHMITENMMCTLDASGKKDVCGGDSGGPLLCKNTLRGIVSFGPKTCGYPKRPSVYTFLTETNLTWIKKVIKKGTNTTY